MSFDRRNQEIHKSLQCEKYSHCNRRIFMYYKPYISNYWRYDWNYLIENIMVAVMLAVIAIAVGFFVLSGIMLKQFDDIKYKQCRVDYQSASYIQNECDHMRTIHSLCLSIGVALCVMSVIPPIIIDALNFEILDDLGGAGVLCFVGIGVFLIVYQANASKAYKVLLSLNNPDTIAGNYANQLISLLNILILQPPLLCPCTGQQ